MIYKARIPEYHGTDDDSWIEVDAFDAERAAEKLAEQHDDECSEGLSETIDVQVLVDGAIIDFAVFGSISYDYSAHKKEI